MPSSFDLYNMMRDRVQFDRTLDAYREGCTGAADYVKLLLFEFQVP